MARLLLFFLFMALAPLFLPAQEVLVNEGPSVSDLMNTWVAANRKNTGIDGWRVQVLSTTDRVQADAAKLKFSSEFPAIYADWVHEKPYYKVRVGACRTRMEALALINEIKDYYPGAYPAKDTRIHPRDFLRKQ